MAILTEQEAKTKWCPLARTSYSTIEELEHGGVNRAQGPSEVSCIASACMMWRKRDQIGIGPDGEKRVRDMDGRTRWVDRGFCGLAVPPEVA